MNEKNTQRIIAACPSLFSEMEDEVDIMFKQLAGETIQPFKPIAFGFECGDGWSDLLVDLCEKIQARLNELSPEVARDIVALQVKEKYGTLRFYLSSYDGVIENLVQEAERKSACVCETCGKVGKIRGACWYYTACDEHTREEDLNPLPESEMP